MRVIGERDGWILAALDEAPNGVSNGGWVNYRLDNSALVRGKRSYQLGYNAVEGRMANGAGWRALCEISADMAQWALTLIEGDARNGKAAETTPQA